MKRNKILRLLMVLTVIGFASCQEDAIELFTGKPALFIGVQMDTDRPIERDMDTLRDVSFGFTELSEININFIVRLQGTPTSTDRKMKIDVSGTALRGTDYEMSSDVVLPAGAHYALIPCKVIRNASMLEGVKEIRLKLLEDETFGVGDTTAAVLTFSDGIPKEWVGNFSAQYLFGNCTTEKYQFLYDFMSYYDLSELMWGDLEAVAKYLNRKIEDYNLDPAKYDNKYGADALTFRFEPEPWGW